MIPNNIQQLLTTRQAAERLNLSHKTLARYRIIGKGPMFRKLGGGSVHYAIEDIEAWAQRHRVTAEYTS